MLQNITLAKLKNNIALAPTKKATGPQLISNEMLKHLNDHTLGYIQNIFNACLKLQEIPSAWKQNLIYPISKKPTFTGQLNHTRLISLIEHTRKIFTKILTIRLSNICSQYPILNNSNFVALPGNSTSTPITLLSHI